VLLTVDMLVESVYVGQLIEVSYNLHIHPPLRARLEKFENGFLTLTMLVMFSVDTTPEKFENATITSHCGFGFGKIPFPKFFICEKAFSRIIRELLSTTYHQIVSGSWHYIFWT